MAGSSEAGRGVGLSRDDPAARSQQRGAIAKEAGQMLEEGAVSDFSGWIQVGVVDTKVGRDAYHYSVPRAASEVGPDVSPGISVSVEEKVSDLIRSYPHLETFLKSHSKDANARIRDLAISSQERDHLLYQIIAARRQQLPAIGTTGRPSQSAPSSQFRTRFYQPRRRKPAQEWPKSGSQSSHAGPVTGRFHKRLWG